MMRPIGGITTSLTSEVTTFPNAAPMMTPTARSMTLPRAANCLNSFHMGADGIPRSPARDLGRLLNFSPGASFVAPFPLFARLRLCMNTNDHRDLSRRERQILDILYQRGQATAAEVQTGLPDPPSYSAVRALLRILEDKGHIRHEQDGPRYVYLPTIARDNAQRSALRHILQTFFDGSAEQAISALLDDRSTRISPAELDRLALMIDTARKSGA